MALLTPEQAAEELAIPEHVINRMVRDRFIESEVRVKGKLVQRLVHKSDIEFLVGIRGQILELMRKDIPRLVAWPAQRVTKPGVYFLKLGEHVKIGVATNIAARFASLQTGAPTILQLVAWQQGDRSKERDLHQKFEKLRAHGEWFRLEEPLARHISDLNDFYWGTRWEVAADA